jgi:hypothetical protein
MYAISRGIEVTGLDETPGLHGGRLAVVEHRALDAVVSDVDLEEFGEDGLRRNLESMEWLEEVARGHDAVVHAVSALGPTAPLRLATICLDDDGVRKRLDEWYDALEQVLDRVQGHREWSVKAFSAPPAAAVSPTPRTGQSEPPASGAAYLQRKKAQNEARQSGEEHAQRLADDLHSLLSRLSTASRRLPAQDPRLTGHEGAMILNGAYLVPADDGAAFAAEFRGLQSRHPDLGLDLQGPWPPYSFAMLEQ